VMDTAILIPSCDRFSDIWASSAFLFNKFWPDCPYPVYFGVNETSFKAPGMTTLTAGRDTGWCGNMRAYLGAIPERRVIMVLDDFWLYERVDTGRVKYAVELFGGLEISCLKLSMPTPGLQLEPTGGTYRISAGPAIWDRRVLAAICSVPGWSAWDFELRGSLATWPRSYTACQYGMWSVRYAKSATARSRGVLAPRQMPWAIVWRPEKSMSSPSRTLGLRATAPG